IRKVVAQRAENNQKIYKKDNFYIISIEIVFFSLIQELYVPDSVRNFLLRERYVPFILFNILFKM
ncbi:IS5/IS1182 family transposase, partial [Staphylococcus aureus]